MTTQIRPTHFQARMKTQASKAWDRRDELIDFCLANESWGDNQVEIDRLEKRAVMLEGIASGTTVVCIGE